MNVNPLTEDQIKSIAAVIDRVKTDDRSLDTDEYVGLIQDVLGRPPLVQKDRTEFLRAAQAAADACRRQCEEETEEPPSADEAFTAGALWVLGLHPEYSEQRAWTFFGHWTEGGELIIDHMVEGEHQDLREDDGRYPGGLWCDSANGTDVTQAEDNIRQAYQDDLAAEG